MGTAIAALRASLHKAVGSVQTPQVIARMRPWKASGLPDCGPAEPCEDHACCAARRREPRGGDPAPGENPHVSCVKADGGAGGRVDRFRQTDGRISSSWKANRSRIIWVVSALPLRSAPLKRMPSSINSEKRAGRKRTLVYPSICLSVSPSSPNPSHNHSFREGPRSVRRMGHLTAGCELQDAEAQSSCSPKP